MVPINTQQDKLDLLAGILNCQTGAFPFTYLGLPLGLRKPNMQDFLPLIKRIEGKLGGISSMLSQGGKLQLVNSVLTSSAMFQMATLKLPKGVIHQIDKFRKHCLWRGSDLTSTKPSKAAWPLVCLPKCQGGLGVLNIITQNEALLLKFLHKFFSKVDLPWVHLIWDKLYSNGTLPGVQKKGSFWWKDIVKLLHKFKGFASARIADGSTVLLWQDSWNDHFLQTELPHLFSFARNKNISYHKAINTTDLGLLFHLPLSTEAHSEFLML